MRPTKHNAPRYIIFSTPLSPRSFSDGHVTLQDSPFLSPHSPAFHRTSVINHLLKIQVRNRWTAVSTWPEVNYSGMTIFILYKCIKNLLNCAGVAQNAQWKQRHGEFIHVPSNLQEPSTSYSSIIHSIHIPCVRKPTEKFTTTSAPHSYREMRTFQNRVNCRIQTSEVRNTHTFTLYWQVTSKETHFRLCKQI